MLLAGPSGEGKSTLCQTRVAPAFAGPFVNADIIQRDELKNLPGLLKAAREARLSADNPVPA